MRNVLATRGLSVALESACIGVIAESLSVKRQLHIALRAHPRVITLRCVEESLRQLRIERGGAQQQLRAAGLRLAQARGPAK